MDVTFIDQRILLAFSHCENENWLLMAFCKEIRPMKLLITIIYQWVFRVACYGNQVRYYVRGIINNSIT